MRFRHFWSIPVFFFLENKTKLIKFYTKFQVKQAKFVLPKCTSFNAVQETIEAKLFSIFQKI